MLYEVRLLVLMAVRTVWPVCVRLARREGCWKGKGGGGSGMGFAHLFGGGGGRGRVILVPVISASSIMLGGVTRAYSIQAMNQIITHALGRTCSWIFILFFFLFARTFSWEERTGSSSQYFCNTCYLSLKLKSRSFPGNIGSNPEIPGVFS